jgi:hypothetical protein
MDTERHENFIGQIDAVRRVNQMTMHAKKTGTRFPHLSIIGAPHSGRSTFARALANRFQGGYELVDGKCMTKIKELLPHLTNLQKGGFLVVRDIEAMSGTVSKFREGSLNRFSVDITLGQGRNMRHLDLKLQPFTLVSISQSFDSLSEAIRDYSVPLFFSTYTHEESLKILRQRAIHGGLDLQIGQIIDAALLSEILFSVNGSTRRAISILTKALALNPKQITYETLELIGHSLPRNTLLSGEQREHLIKKMTGVEFELYIADVLRKKGYIVKLTKASGDHGIDLQIIKSGITGVVQCKQWDETVGEPHLRDFFGAMIHCGAKFGFFVTTSSFTLQARSFAHGKNIQLIDGRQLVTDIDWFL